jgi:hypothetical protein
MALPAFVVEIAAMNSYWLFPVSAVTPVFTRASFCPSCHQKRVMEFGEWPAAMTNHIPDQGMQMGHYYRYTVLL